MTLFFVLSQKNLEIYTQKYEFEHLIESLHSYDQILELSEKFQKLWHKIYEQYIQNADLIYLIILPKAGFTDTRIVSIWCRTQVMFDPKCKFEIYTQEQWEQKDTVSSLEKNLDNNNADNNKIQYSQSPKIGIKI